MKYLQLKKLSNLVKLNFFENVTKRNCSNLPSYSLDEVKKQKEEWNLKHQAFNWSLSREIVFNHNKIKDKHRIVNQPKKEICETSTNAFIKLLTRGKNVFPSVCLELVTKNLQNKDSTLASTFYFNVSSNVNRFLPFYLTQQLEKADYILFTRLQWEAIVDMHEYVREPETNNFRSAIVCGPTGLRKLWNIITDLIFSTLAKSKVNSNHFVYEICDSLSSFVDSKSGTKFSMINLKPTISTKKSTNNSTLLNNVAACYMFEIPGMVANFDNLPNVANDPQQNPKQNVNTKINVTEVDVEDNNQSLTLNFSNAKECFSKINGLPEETENRNDTQSNLNYSKETEKNDLILNFSFVIFVDCPSIAYIPALINAFGSSFDDTKTYTVVHMTAVDVLNTVDYQNWILKFHETCNHIFVNENTSTNVENLKRHHVTRNLCNLITPHFFPIYNAESSIMPLKDSKSIDLQFNNDYYKLWKNSCNYFVNQEGKITKLKSRIANFLESLNNYENIYGKTNDVTLCSNFNDITYPRLVVLGSGGVCSRLRANPCFLVMIDKDRSVMLDCGYSALSQLEDHFGHFTPRVLSTIKLIILTHRHTDHFLGIVSMLNAIKRHKSYEITHVVFSSHLHHNLFLKYVTKHNSYLQENVEFKIIGKYPKYEVIADIKDHIGLKYLYLPMVSHGVFTIGVVMVINGFKLVYSSDTLPMSKFLLEKGQYADLLIHDCLYVSSDRDIEACFKNHSTFQGAIETAKAMQAKTLLTTHFSQVEDLVPVENLTHSSKKFKGLHMYAIDHLELPLNVYEFKELTKYHDQFKTMFSPSTRRLKKRKKESDVIKKKNMYLESFALLKKNNS